MQGINHAQTLTAEAPGEKGDGLMTLRDIARLALGLAALLTCAGLPARAQMAVRIESGVLVLPSTVRFEAGADVLAPGSEQGLTQVMQFLAEKPYITLLRVETNASVQGNSGANLALGEARARRLAAWFAAHGADCKRLIYVTHGQNKPIAAGQDEANERVDFAPAALRGRPIGGLPLDGAGLVVQEPCP